MRKSEQAGRDRPYSGSLTLGGKTVLVTRARAQSEDITTKLEALGASVIHCPTIEVVPPDSWASLDASIQRIKEYDWIVFTSANGVHYFLRRLNSGRTEGVNALTALVVCAIGPATARALRDAGVVV